MPPSYCRARTGATRLARLNRRQLSTFTGANRWPTTNALYFNLSSGGDVVIKLRPDLAPGHVERIKELASSGFYDGVPFHRVIPGFMAQGGDPTGRGTGGSDLSQPQGRVQREPHVRGVCSMARTQDPNSANSQFFICFDDARFLDNQYTVWGEVESGMDHVDALPKGEPPANPGKIVKAEIRPAS